MNCTNIRLHPVAMLRNRRDYYINVVIGVGYINLIIVIICYSAIIGRLACARCHPQIFPSPNQAGQSQRREMRLGLQFAVISTVFFCTAIVSAVQTSAIESQLGLYIILLIMMSIDTPLLCICNPILRVDILRVIKCGTSAGSKEHKLKQHSIKLNFNKANSTLIKTRSKILHFASLTWI